MSWRPSSVSQVQPSLGFMRVDSFRDAQLGEDKEVPMAVAIYQLVIGSIVVLSSFVGRSALYRTTLVLSLWTLTHVFMPWLLALQAATIAVAFTIGRSRVRAQSPGA